jgi:hypothetical protein
MLKTSILLPGDFRISRLAHHHAGGCFAGVDHSSSLGCRFFFSPQEISQSWSYWPTTVSLAQRAIQNCFTFNFRQKGRWEVSIPLESTALLEIHF